MLNNEVESINKNDKAKEKEEKEELNQIEIVSNNPISKSPTETSLTISTTKSQSNSLVTTPTIHLETIPETIQDSDESKHYKKSLTPQNQPNTSSHQRVRNRTDSIRHITDKFRSFSNDLLRSIENAQEMIDIKNSNFSAATQSAAAHAAQQHHIFNNQTYEYDPYHLSSINNSNSKDKSSISNRSKKLSKISCTAEANTDNDFKKKNENNINSDENNYDLDDIYSNKNFKLDNTDNSQEILSRNNKKPLDEINVLNEIDESNHLYLDNILSKRVSYENNSLNKIKNEIMTNEKELNQNKKNESNKNLDQVDFRVRKRYVFKNGSKKSIPDDIHISILEVFIYLWGVITFFADLVSDIILSIEYFNSSRIWLASMTLMLVIVPNITLSLFSLSWYIDKYYSEKQLHEQKLKEQQSNGNRDNNFMNSPLPKTTCDSISFWIMTILFVIFQLDLVWKYIQGFIYTLKGWACRSLFQNLKWEKYYIEKQIKCDTDIGMLRLIDVFLDSGPQVLLQLYVITTQNLNELGSANIVLFTFKDFQTTSTEIKQLVSILSSLFSMGYALAGYHRCLRNQQFIFCLETNKPLPHPMKWISTIMQFLWYLFLIAPRVLSMALFASTFRSWFFMIIFTHWLIMYFWILRLKTNYCITSEDVYSAREEIFEKFYDLVCSFIYVFVYFNLKAGPTRIRYLIYYLVFYSENILFCTCYFFFSKESNFTYKLTMLLIVMIGFWVAITFQVVYYLHCHPSHDIQICVRKKSKFHFIHKEELRPAHFYDFSELGENQVSKSTSSNESIEKNSAQNNNKETQNFNNFELKNNQIVKTHATNLIINSAKTSSSSSSFDNENENSASTFKLITTNNGNNLAGESNQTNSNILIYNNKNNNNNKKGRKRFFKNNFTQFLNLYSSSNSSVIHVHKNPDDIVKTKCYHENTIGLNKNTGDQIEVNRNFKIENKSPKSNIIMNHIDYDTSIVSYSDIISPLSIKSKSFMSSFSSFSSYSNNTCSSKNSDYFNHIQRTDNNYLTNNSDFSIETLTPPIVNEESYDNLSISDSNNMNRNKIVIVTNKSYPSAKNKETFL